MDAVHRSKAHSLSPHGRSASSSAKQRRFCVSAQFATYSLLVAGGASKKRMLEAMAAGEKTGEAVAASDQLLAPGSRLAQIREWLQGTHPRGSHRPLMIASEGGWVGSTQRAPWSGVFGSRQQRAERSRAWPPHRPREDGLAHAADPSRTDVAAALRWRLTKQKVTRVGDGLGEPTLLRGW